MDYLNINKEKHSNESSDNSSTGFNSPQFSQQAKLGSSGHLDFPSPPLKKACPNHLNIYRTMSHGSDYPLSTPSVTATSHNELDLCTKTPSDASSLFESPRDTCGQLPYSSDTCYNCYNSVCNCSSDSLSTTDLVPSTGHCRNGNTSNESLDSIDNTEVCTNTWDDNHIIFTLQPSQICYHSGSIAPETDQDDSQTRNGLMEPNLTINPHHFDPL